VRTATKSIRLKNKGDKTVYTVQITGEQITLVRSLYLRVEQVWIRSETTSRVIRENGDVDCIMLYECQFCRKGSHESAGSISHKKDCIVALADAEWEAMNAQFIEALNGGEDDPAQA